MRNRFDEQLSVLNTELIKMGALCEEAIRNVAAALADGDLLQALHAIEIDKEIDEKEKQIENLCLKLLLQQQPVAKDLRLISAALKMITDMERIGDQATDIGEIILLDNVYANRGQQLICDMAQAVTAMVTDSVDAFVKRDLAACRKVIQKDDVVDNLFDEVKQWLIATLTASPGNNEMIIDMLMIGKYMERIGDHAVNIAQWVEFSITGEHIEEKKMPHKLSVEGKGYDKNNDLYCGR